MRVPAFALALLAATLGASCGKDAATPTPATPTPTSPTTSTFASRLTVGGAVSRSFIALQSGTVSVTLTNAAGTATVVGLGLGIPSGGVATCTLSTAIKTTAGPTPQISAAVDPGPYCVVVYDVGTLPDPIDFSITLVYP